MKTWKQGIFGLIAIITLAFVFSACDDGKGDDDPNAVKEQTATVVLAHGVGSITVKGNMTAAQWSGVPGKVKNHIDTTIGGQMENIDNFKQVFGRGVTYIVEPNPDGYDNYKTIGDGKTAYVALSKVDVTPGILIGDLYNNKTVTDGVIVGKAGKAVAVAARSA